MATVENVKMIGHKINNNSNDDDNINNNTLWWGNSSERLVGDPVCRMVMQRKNINYIIVI